MQAARGLQLILVDCSSKIPADMSSKYKVDGFPTIIFVKPDGSEVGRMQDRSAAGVSQQFLSLAREHSMLPKWLPNLEEAITSAKEAKKPILLFIGEPSNPTSPVFEGFLASEAVRPLHDSFVFLREDCSKDSKICQELKLKKGMVMVVIDPEAEKPLAQPVHTIKTVKSPEKLKKEIEEALAILKKKQAGATK